MTLIQACRLHATLEYRNLLLRERIVTLIIIFKLNRPDAEVNKTKMNPMQRDEIGKNCKYEFYV